MRLIDADKLLNKSITVENVNSTGRTKIMVDRNDIDNAPTIDAEPVVHAHWIKLDDNGRELAIPYCSQCLHLPLRNNGYAIELTDYCPHCGAKMDEEAERE